VRVVVRATGAGEAARGQAATAATEVMVAASEERWAEVKEEVGMVVTAEVKEAAAVGAAEQVPGA
jgi:hypothetical protein